MKTIRLVPIGIIHTPYKTPEGMAIQSKFDRHGTGQVKLFSKYRKGLKDIKGFSHLILIYHFHREKREMVIVRPFLEDKNRGVFSTRSPLRPNHLGFSVVQIKKIHKDGFDFWGVDMLNQTPLLDIKPYITHIDSRKNVKNGWFQKHLRGGKIPRRARIMKNHLA